MKLEILKKSLELYLKTVNDENERTEVIRSISEVEQQSERYESRDLFDDDIYIITPETIIELLDRVTYDEYGKLRRQSETVTIEQYSDLLKNRFSLPELTDNIMSVGIEVIEDFWVENEEYGNNNPDGTFNYND